jgi:UDP-glucose 4-epimerase
VGDDVSLDLNGMGSLVLGGSGFIGKNLCRALVANGATVRSFARDNPFPEDDAPDWAGQVEWVHGAFSDSELIRKSLRDVEVVFHLISTTLPATSNQNVRFDLSSNVEPTLRLLEAARDIGVRKVVFISSAGTVYGIANRVPIPEDHATHPICAYGIHKLLIERYLHLFHYLWKLDYGVLRVSNAYGVGQPVDRPQGVIANFMDKVMKAKPFEIWGDGRVVRDYVFVDDVIDAVLLLVGYSGPSRIFNIGSGKGHTLLELISTIENVVGRSAEVRFLEGRPADVPINVLDINRATSELKWRPTTDLQTGIQRMFEHALDTQRYPSLVRAT